jgi:hypothetical protein
MYLLCATRLGLMASHKFAVETVSTHNHRLPHNYVSAPLEPTPLAADFAKTPRAIHWEMRLSPGVSSAMVAKEGAMFRVPILEEHWSDKIRRHGYTTAYGLNPENYRGYM